MDEFEIFQAVAQFPPGTERNLQLELSCGGDVQLRRRIEALLRAHDDPESFLEHAPNGDEQLVSPSDALDETIDQELERDGRRIGPYKLLQQIGEGGMGVVYMAEQAKPVKRRVALKIIKPGMDSREVIARFEAERQALAMMDHPNIAKVLDAGATTYGRPYFVMEFVNGAPLTQYCDENQLSTRERLDLFVAVCRAVHHAHQKGVIHRDLKPSNILVAQYDNQVAPKVIDFGVAKATNQQLTEKTLFTQFGQIVGTLEYMSPEQAKRNQLDVDTRSDVYSLGIVLYELLTGETPFDRKRMSSAALEELLRIIREEEPPLPSLNLSNSNQIAAIAASRRVEPNRLTALIRGDLDWIVLKSLQKDRADRYGGAIELAEDLQRHLDDRPITAGPPRLGVRIKKFVRRNAWPLLIATVCLGLVMTSLAWIVQTSISSNQQLVARSQRTSSAIDSASVALGLAVKSPVSSEAEWTAADSAVQRVKDQLAGGSVSTEVEARAEQLISRAASLRTERDLSVRLENVLITSASHPDLESWQRMEKELRQIFADHGFDLDREDPMQIAKKIREHQFSTRFSDVLELWIATRGRMSSIGGPAATRESMQPWAEAIYAADSDKLRTGIRRIIYTQRTPPTKQYVAELIEGYDLSAAPPRTLAWLSIVYRMARMPEEADRITEEALLRHPKDVMLAFDHALALDASGRNQEALRMFSRAVALRPDAAGIWQMMGISLKKVGELENSQKAFQQACKLEPDYGPSWANLAEVLLELKRYDAAESAARKAIEMIDKRPDGYGVLGRALLRQGKTSQALPMLERCHELGEQDPRWKQPSQEWLDECRRIIAKESTDALEDAK